MVLREWLIRYEEDMTLAEEMSKKLRCSECPLDGVECDRMLTNDACMDFLLLHMNREVDG